ncbi:hypothetical protein [Streptomyces sp. NPDC088789]|uniref:hypothetical protein n=1 Tax=Streptomyces sp. NPDC088789 TaxID=3365899 RepID=UPI0037F6B398
MIDVQGTPLNRPRLLGIDEFSTLTNLRWRSWGSSKATATGHVNGVWCDGRCPEGGFPATVELSGLDDRENVSYYTRARVVSAGLPHERAAELSELHLYVPEP